MDAAADSVLSEQATNPFAVSSMAYCIAVEFLMSRLRTFDTCLQTRFQYVDDWSDCSTHHTTAQNIYHRQLKNDIGENLIGKITKTRRRHGHVVCAMAGPVDVARKYVA